MLLLTPLTLITLFSAFNAKISFDSGYFRNSILPNLLRIRIPATIGHENVRKYIESKMLELGWEVSLDIFKSPTPLNKQITFYNIISTYNKHAPMRLTVACHYDSKYFMPSGSKFFVGAIDSAVPCSMMIYIAELLTPFLRRNNQTTLQLLFLDGEEAFVKWSASDSLYGSRHIIKELSSNFVKHTGNGHITMLRAIELFILLDLIGYTNPKIYSFYQQTTPQFEQICQIEKKLFGSTSSIFQSPAHTGLNGFNSYIEDDQVPFVLAGVPAIHMIPIPFPPTWHTLADDASSIDMDSTQKITLILIEYIMNYLKLH